MITPWTRSRTARQVRTLVGESVAPGPWLVIDQPELARALGKAPGASPIVESPEPVPGEPAGELGAVIAPVRLVDDSSAPDRLGTWRRAVRAGGVIVLVGAGDRTRPGRWLLAAGLTEPRQALVGRIVVTAGNAPVPSPPG